VDKYKKAIRENVCEICVDSNEKGFCTMDGEEVCAVQLYLPKIVEIVHNLDTENMEEYYKLMKDQICANCNSLDGKGACYLRDDVNCSIDRYYMIIVDTIKKVDAGLI